MRLLMQIVQSGYPPDNNAAVGMNPAHTCSARCQIMNDGDISPSQEVWSQGNVSNIPIRQCLLA